MTCTIFLIIALPVMLLARVPRQAIEDTIFVIVSAFFIAKDIIICHMRQRRHARLCLFCVERLLLACQNGCVRLEERAGVGGGHASSGGHWILVDASVLT